MSKCRPVVLNMLQLEVIMSRLLDVGSAVATPADSSSQQKLSRVQFPKESTAQLEVRWRTTLVIGFSTSYHKLHAQC